MEKLLGITIPPRAAYIRMILAEMQRLASHLVWLATHAVDIGAITPFFYTFRERDAILDLFEEYCGARLTLNTMKIGGVPFELPDGWVDQVLGARRRVWGAHRRVREASSPRTASGRKRTIGIGVVSAEDAVEWGLTGPPLRVARASSGTFARSFPTTVTTRSTSRSQLATKGDTYDRYLVRIEEMRQSVRIIRQCLDRLPERPLHGEGIEGPARQGSGHGLRLGGGSEG